MSIDTTPEATPEAIPESDVQPTSHARLVLMAGAVIVAVVMIAITLFAVHQGQVHRAEKEAVAQQEMVWLHFTPDQQRNMCTMTTDPDLLVRFLTTIADKDPDFDSAAFTTVLFEHC